MYRYEGTHITVERVVNPPKTQLIDALMESYGSPEKKSGPVWSTAEAEPVIRSD